MKKQILILISAIILIIGVFLLTRSPSASSGILFEIDTEILETNGIDYEIEDEAITVEAEEREADLNEMVFVDVQGEVVYPGVYEVNSHVRIGYLIDLAGGLTDYAFVRGLNQAARVYDEMMIFVPHVDDVDEVVMIGLESSNKSEDQVDESGLISLSIASAVELQSLPGIGPTLSANIIAYREENGVFSTIDELVNVSGIGSSTLENIREFAQP